MEDAREISITIAENGPYLVSGPAPLALEAIETDAEGTSIGWKRIRSLETGDRYALCRCGRSESKPFCDGTHKRIGFDGTETAARTTFAEQAKRLEGPAMVLEDAEPLCSFARFCDADGGIWEQVDASAEPRVRAQMEREAGHCPSGRLVVRPKIADRVEAPLEPALEPSIVVAEDPSKDASGPLWIRGGATIAASDGYVYERRARVTLCRCGASANKPFCDGSHVDVAFRDGL